MIQFLISGRLKVSKDTSGKAIAAAVDPNDLVERDDCYIIRRAKKYTHIREVAAAVADYERQLPLWR